VSATATRPFAIDSLNHVVLRVRDLERSKAFYRDALGLQVRRERAGRMVFFTCGVNDHDVAIMSLGPDAPPAEDTRAGLYHFALRLPSFEQLRAAYHHLKASDVNIVPTAATVRRNGHRPRRRLRPAPSVNGRSDEPAATRRDGR
jgi:catechol-2,3-dioxygenase